MEWIYLVVAGLFECGWAIGLKYTEAPCQLPGETGGRRTSFTRIPLPLRVW
jgi:hypothetical protein